MLTIVCPTHIHQPTCYIVALGYDSVWASSIFTFLWGCWKWGWCWCNNHKCNLDEQLSLAFTDSALCLYHCMTMTSVTIKKASLVHKFRNSENAKFTRRHNYDQSYFVFFFALPDSRATTHDWSHVLTQKIWKWEDRLHWNQVR